MLQENSITIYYSTGIFYGSLHLVSLQYYQFASVLLRCFFFNFDEGEIRKGIYGFNAALVGIALLLGLNPLFIIWCLIVVGAIVATLIHHLFYTKTYQLYACLCCLVNMDILFFKKVYPLPQRTIISNNDTLGGYILFRNYGQVIFVR